MHSFVVQAYCAHVFYVLLKNTLTSRQQGFYLNFFNEDLKFCTNLIKFIMILI